VDMGFGRQLLSALRRVVTSGHSEVSQGWSAVVLASHPPVRTRIARLEAMLRRDDSTGSDRQRRRR
jgi:Zn-dependent protease with chaperone function